MVVEPLGTEVRVMDGQREFGMGVCYKYERGRALPTCRKWKFGNERG